MLLLDMCIDNSSKSAKFYTYKYSDIYTPNVEANEEVKAIFELSMLHL